MPVFSNSNKNILFIHIPKTAGSSIEKIGKDLGWVESFSVRGRSLNDLKFYKSTPQHLHAKPLELIFNLDQFDSIFTVVRNPFNRLKSEYYWQYSQKITDLDVDEWVPATLDQYLYNAHIYDNHIRPQVEFLPKSKKVEVLKLEEGGVELAKNIFLSLSPEVPTLGLWKSKFLSKSIPKVHIKRSAKDPSIEDKFKKHYNMIFNFYEKDFNSFSY